MFSQGAADIIHMNIHIYPVCIVLQVKVWFQNRRMKWKRVKGTKLAKDKVDGHLKPIMAPNVTSTCKSTCDTDDLHKTVMADGVTT